MTPHQLENPSPDLELRVETLEAKLKQIKQILSDFSQKKAPWWSKVAGSFENEPNFDEAVRFGQEWRKSAE